MHGNALYDPVLHIPLILRDPTRRGSGQRIAAQVRLVDVLPTLLDLVGVPVPPDTDGRTLVPLLDGGETADRPVYAELLHPNSLTPLVRRVAIRDGDYKLIVNAPPLAPNEAATELYDLRSDPGEQHNLATAEPARADALTDLLRAQRKGIEEAGLAGFGTEHVRGDVRERLRALGYVQ
jgi:arylsulfatase A-like enzyme